MLPLLLLLVVTQVPCAQGDPTIVCHCKQGQESGCAALRVSDPKLADAIESAVLAVKLDQEAQRRQTAKAEASSNAPEPPDCKGQEHHVISRPIAKELEQHEILRGRYRPRAPRFKARAKDEDAHCGYQDWHRKVDKEVIEWLRTERRATPKQFEKFLREIYNRPEMRERFPHGF